LAIDALDVYWPQYNTIYKTPKTGGAITQVEHPENGASALKVAVDDDCLFYTHGGFGNNPPPSLVRAPK